MAGMTSNTRDGRHCLGLGWGACSNQSGEVAIDPETYAGTLLRVELGREHVAARDDRGESHAVLGLADDVCRIGGIDVKRVDEIEVGVIWDTFEERMLVLDAHGVP